MFSRFSSLVPTWYKQQKSSPDLLLNIAVSPPSALVLEIGINRRLGCLEATGQQPSSDE